MNVQPVEGAYLAGVPHIAMTVEPAIGARLVRTGAFAEGGDGGDIPGGVEFPLDFYDPPESEPSQDQDPPEGGSSDSEG